MVDSGSSILGVHQHTGQVLTLALFYCDDRGVGGGSGDDDDDDVDHHDNDDI